MFYFKLSLLLLLFTFLRIKAFNFPKDNHIFNARNSFNISSESDQRWLLKAATPSYLQDFLNVIKTDSKYTEILQNNLFDGVSYTCSQHVEQWLIKLTNPTWDNLATDRNKWVLQLIDAWGKIPEGILSGHINSFGDFDECIQVEVKNLPILDTSVSRKFDGLYCTSYILDYATAMEVTPVPISSMQETVKEENSVQKSLSLEELLQLMFGLKPFGAMPLIPSVGVCFPNSCSQLDVQQLLVNGLVQVYSQSPDANFTALPWPVTISCTDRHKPSPDAGTIATLVILGILIGLALAAGVLDYWNQNYPSNSNSSLTSSKHYQYLMAFSIYSNTIKLVSTRRSPEDLGCLHGIRFLSTAWVVLAHTYVMFIGGPQWNLIDLNEVYKHWPEMTVINGSFSVDTFFMMSGMLATYNLLKVLDKQKGRINIPMIYLHRYIRLTPTYMILIAIFTTLTTYTGNGPFWFVWKVLEDGCRKNWWTNIIYLNNIVNAKEYCNGETWYLANDMQFFVLSPLIIYPLWKWEKIGASLLAFYSVLSWMGPILVHRFATDAPAAPVFTRVEGQTPGVADIYDRPWCRIGAFLVGIWLGWILHKTRGKRVKLSFFYASSIWLTSAGIACALMFGIFPWFDPANEIPEVPGYFYAGLSRFSWAVSIALVVFACIKGYGGIVNQFLSWSAFMPLGRLCFCVYLVSVHLQQIFHTRLSVPIKWDSYTVINLFFAHMVTSYFVGFLCTLLFESPFIVLQKLIFEGGNKPKTQPTKVERSENNNNGVEK